MKKTLFVAVTFPLLAAFSASFVHAQSLASVPLTQDEAKIYVAGNTFEYSPKQGQTTRIEFKKNGEVIAVTNPGKHISKGIWTVDELGQLCQAYSKSTQCSLLYRGDFALWTKGKSPLKSVN